MSDDSTLAALANTTPANPAAPDGELAGGTIVAERWTIVRFLARGGMGEVYEAHDRLLDGPVALKTLRSGMAHERFVREVQLARKVSHPNVCRIHDAGRHGALSFLTMELLTGEALSDRIKRGPMSVTDARPILADLAAALDAAHAAGVIHRDFKPHNVMLVHRGDGTRAVVTDFGIARAADDDGTASLTGADEIVGTPAYMAPEQVNGKPVTAATDVYSFGVVAYEMVTGSLPFTGQNAREIATARLTATPRPPRELVKDLDPRWNAAILAALAVDPAARPASTGAVLARAEQAAATTATSRSSPRTRPPWLAVAASAAALGALAVFVLWLASRGDSRTRTPPPIPTEPAATMTDDATPRRKRLVELARDHYERGRDAFEAGRYDEAISAFLQVDEDLRTYPMLYNIAQAYRKKGDLHQAVYFYRRTIMAAEKTGRPFEMRKDIEQYIRDLEALMAGDGGVPAP